MKSEEKKKMNRRNHFSGICRFMLFIALAAGSLQACTHANEEELYGPALDCDTIPPTFSESIQAITSAKCATPACHAGLSPSAGLFLETYPQVKAIADNGRMMERVVIQKTMPPNGALTACELKAIEDWLDAGAPE